MEQIKFIVNTTMSKEDYRKFLYIATFRRNKLVIPLLCLIALLGGMIISWDNHLDLTKLIISWILLFALAILVVVFKIERKYVQRIKTDKTGTFDSVNTLKFYDDKIVIESRALNSKGEMKYDQFFALMESKDYFMFYLTANQASLVRKRDIDGLEAFKEFIMEKFKGRYKRV